MGRCCVEAGWKNRRWVWGLRLKQRRPGLSALTIPDPPLIHCMVPWKSGFSEARFLAQIVAGWLGSLGWREREPQRPLRLPSSTAPQPNSLRPDLAFSQVVSCPQTSSASPPCCWGWGAAWQREPRGQESGEGGGHPLNCLCPLSRLEN